MSAQGFWLFALLALYWAYCIAWGWRRKKTASDHFVAGGGIGLWVFVLAGTALSLMYLGGLQILQAASVVVGLPLIGVMGAMVVSLMRHLKRRT